MATGTDKTKNLKQLSLLCLFFAGVFFITGLVMNTGKNYLNTVVPESEQPSVKQMKGNFKVTYEPVGPVSVDKKNTVMNFEVGQLVPLNAWSHVSIHILNANKAYITGFGEGLWHEDGYDAEGYYWEESKEHFDMKMTIPDPGKYYFKVIAERSYLKARDQYQRVQLKVTGNKGSALPLNAAGIISLIAGFILFMYANKESIQEGMEA